MKTIVSDRTAGKGPRHCGASTSDRLHDLARQVERLPVSGRLDPEQILIAKFGIATELRRLARETRA